MPEKKVQEKLSAVIQWVTTKNGASPRRDYIPTRIRMGNGVEIPFMGLGTGGAPSSEKEVEFALRTALDLGYTHIDTASIYGTEAIVGKVVKEYIDSGKLNREDIFITTKLPCTSHDRPSVEQSLRAQLKDLQMEYVDLFLVNTPCGVRVRSTPRGLSTSDASYTSLPDTWKGMEDVYNLKLARSIGISNFNVDQIQRVYSTATVKPHNLQVEVNLHWPQKEFVVLCQSLNMSLTAYAPIGSPGQRRQLGLRDLSPLEEPVVLWLAEKYKKSPAQILLRHLTQRNIVVIPKSTDAQRLRDNLESMKFSLTDQDMEELGRVRPRARVYTFRHRRTHPEYPFCELDDVTPSDV
ncbi:unnamed protein product [Caenorhabditis sp. 36 PRJEB53466]|nr:unnamed protein product [Caenorhabditis sp. 36 PRJEB53466]